MKELCLKPRTHLCNFVQKDGPSVRQLELSDLRPHGAGKGPPLKTEQLAFQKFRGEGGAVDPDHQFLFSQRLVVDRLGDELFSDAAFTQDQNGGIGSCNPPDHFFDPDHLAIDADEIALFIQLLAKVPHLSGEGHLLKHFLQRDGELIVLERLHQVIGRPHLHRFDDGAGLAHGRQHHHWKGAVDLMDFPKGLQSIHPRHHDV